MSRQRHPHHALPELWRLRLPAFAGWSSGLVAHLLVAHVLSFRPEVPKVLLVDPLEALPFEEEGGLVRSKLVDLLHCDVLVPNLHVCNNHLSHTRVNVDPDLVVMAPSLSEAPLATTIEKLLGRASLSRYTYRVLVLNLTLLKKNTKNVITHSKNG